MPDASHRFRVLSRATPQEKTPILAELGEAKTADGVATLRLYDVIDSWGGYWGVSAKEFAQALDALPKDTTEIRLHINSPGGESTEGLAIMNLLRQHPAKVVSIVDGLAASAASYVACAGELVMAPHSELMIHDAWGAAVGNAEVMEQARNLLDHISGNLADIYAAKAGGTSEQWREAMKAETWYTAEEAVASGLADRVLELDQAPDAAAAKARFDLTVYAYAGREHAPAPRSPEPPSATGSTNTATLEAEMSLSDALRERLGIADENADEDTILAALDEALAEQTDPPAPTAEVTVSPEALAEVTRLSTQVAELTAAAALREKTDRFAAWQRDGKVAPAERDRLEAMYDAAPEQTAALLDARAKNSAVPVAAIGVSADGELSDEDHLYAELFGDEKKVS